MDSIRCVLAAAFAAVTLLTFATQVAAATGAPSATTCAIDELPGLSAQLQRARREAGIDPASVSSTASPAQLGRIADFWQVAYAVLAMVEKESLDPRTESHAARVDMPSLQQLPCNTPVRTRDRLAWTMALGGYSAREIADVLNGHLTRADLDEALRRSMAGQPRTVVAAFLESRWREPAPALQVPSPAPVVLELASGEYENEMIALARDHRVEPALIRAVIAVESAGNANAVSSAGAIGLMQLMPRTAAALGVNPWHPSENLRGGIAYLASLLRAYGEDVRLALIAYNAGPQHADLVRSGRAVAYRETRKYVEAIGVRYPIK